MDPKGPPSGPSLLLGLEAPDPRGLRGLFSAPGSPGAAKKWASFSPVLT